VIALGVIFYILVFTLSKGRVIIEAIIAEKHAASNLVYIVSTVPDKRFIRSFISSYGANNPILINPDLTTVGEPLQRVRIPSSLIVLYIASITFL